MLLAGADAQDTKLTVSGRADVFAEPGGCTFVLRLENTVISGPDGKRNTQAAQLGDLQLSRPVRFTLLNDRLEPQLCAEPADSVFGLNVKRAIVSLLQSTEAASETDVFGTCPQTSSASTDGECGIPAIPPCGWLEATN